MATPWIVIWTVGIVNDAGLEVRPPTVTMIFPEAGPVTVPTICVLFQEVTVMLAELNVAVLPSWVAPKFVPPMVTV
jgi:hypothetical protein